MKLTAIIYRDKVPAEIKTAVEPIFNRHVGIVPNWCERIVISYDDDVQFVARTSGEMPYRKAYITLTGGFLSETAESRERGIVHELFHVVCAPAHDYAMRELRRLLEKAPAEHRATVLDEFRDQCEGVVQDLTNQYLDDRLSLSVDEQF